MQVFRIAMAGVVAGWLATVCAQAQEKEHSLLSQAVQSRGIQLSIHSGRVVLEGARGGNLQSSVVTGGRGKEQINLRNDNGNPLLTYERSTAAEKLSIDIASGGRVQIRRTPKAKSDIMPVEFVQTPEEKTTLTLGANEQQVAYHAAGLWHLLLAQPRECQQHLIPLLQLLQSDWKLSALAANVEEKLLASAASSAPVQRARWVELVEQLGDERYAKREAADRALRAADPSVVGYLQQLDFHRLDAEQQFRLRRIMETLADQMEEDSPEQVAASLAGDPAIWLALLGRAEPAIRRSAARQLTALLGAPLPVDPNADPAAQREQREQVRVRIEEK